MGCNSSKLQDIVMHEDYSYRRPVLNEKRKGQIKSHELAIDTCGNHSVEFKCTTSDENGMAKQEIVKSRSLDNNQTDTGSMTDKIDADQSVKGENEDMLIILQRNNDELIDKSHEINNYDGEVVVNRFNQNTKGQDLHRIESAGAKIVSKTKDLKEISYADLFSDTDEKNDTSELKEISYADLFSDTDDESDTKLKGIENTRGQVELKKVKSTDSNHHKEMISKFSGGTNMEDTETPNSLFKEERTSIAHSNENIEGISKESRLYNEPKRHNENKTADNTVTERETKLFTQEEADPKPDKEPIKDNENETVDEEKTEKETIPLTKEESESVSMMFYGKIKTLIDIMKDQNWITDDGSIAEGVCHLIDVLRNCYSALYQIGALYSHVKEFREKVAKLVLETKIAEKLCEIVVYACEKMPVSKYKKADNDLHVPVHYAMHVFGNFTDTSPELAERIANYPNFLAVQRKIQKDFTDAEFHGPEPAPDESDCLCGKCIVSSSLCMIHNISMVESTIPLLRGHNFVEVLQPYLKSKDKEDHLSALATLAAIVDEKESKIINSNQKVVKYLMKTLKYGLRREERRYNGWSCKECGLTVKVLARNDANKKLLVQLGALKLLAKLAKGNTEEQIEAAGALWALSFDEDNRREMVENKKLRVIKRLSDLKASDTAKIKTAATGALWNLREDLRKSEDAAYQELGNGFVTDVTDKAVIQKRISRESLKVPSLAGQGHIFISYQWTNQRILIDIRNELIKNGHRVWMDVDNMQGSTLQAMAEAVEDADIVLVCFSQKYKNSPNCRAEAEYTFQRQKPIIPLRMETNYKPDGWLGILVGTKLFYDFSGKYNFQDKLNKLIKDITSMKTDMLNDDTPKIVEPLYHSVDRVDGPVVQQAPETLKSSTTTEDIKTWTADDVRNWIRKHNLPEAECSSFTCDEIGLLLKMMNEAPESFYKGLQRKFNYDLKIISQLVKALEAINTH